MSDVPKEFEIWVCGHTRKCRWSGPESELKYIPDGDKALPSFTATCPNCGNSEFYIRDSRKGKKNRTIDQCCNQPEGTFAQFCKDHPDPDAYALEQAISEFDGTGEFLAKGGSK